ncbi:GNAT family N-acetyltransferase [Streptomyces sp. NPDC101209]|uniref:GNAT family N-acetyltransferase n=1 Tax=Streptomyces sp. NPDC101209 TaxID=3366129 RepID=UPI0037F572BC
MTFNPQAEATAREENNAELIAILEETGQSDAESSWDLDIFNDEERGRWVAMVSDEAIAELSYRFVGGRIVLLTTWVNPAYRNHQVATEVISHALDEIRQTGKRITIICPVVGEFIERHREYIDLIDKVHPGSGAHPRARKESLIASMEHDLS